MNMKIKEVSSQTGLTSNTILYYIEQQLISPICSENYLGKHIYKFSEQDVEALKEIATLRKIGFSVADIRVIKQKPAESAHVISELKKNKSGHIQDEQQLIEKLDTLENRDYTLSQLSQAVNENVTNITAPNDGYYIRQKSIIGNLIAFLIIAAIPFLFAFIHNRFLYPAFHFYNILFIILTFLPLLFAILLYFVPISDGKKEYRIIMRTLLVITLVLSFFFSFGIADHSETTDLGNYLKFDSYCAAYENTTLQELFPVHCKNDERILIDDDGNKTLKKEDVRYYYNYHHFLFDHTYDVYAEWPLDKEEFDNEVDRVRTLFDKWKSKENSAFVELQKGSYRCLFWYTEVYGRTVPFEPVTCNYEYSIFAYDEKNLRVRYIDCYSLEDGTVQPYYLKLEW